MFFDAVIYGGTFDPVHEGHLKVVKTLHDEMGSIHLGLVVIATTFKNPWKTKIQPAKHELRLSMWEAILKDSKIPYSRKPKAAHVYLCDHIYEYSADFIKWWRQTYKSPHSWVTSTDSAGNEKDWKDWPALNVEMKIMPMYGQIHSTSIRNGETPPHPAIRQIIAENGIYPNSKWS